MTDSKIEKKHGVVAILDALGTKGIWQRKDPQAVIETWDSLVSLYQTLSKSSKISGYTRTISAFSDTVIITGEGDDLEKVLIEMGVDIGLFVIHSMLEGIYFRGGISVGDFYKSDKMIIGPAIDEAAEYYTLSDWIGVSASPSAYNILHKMGREKMLSYNMGEPYVSYDIPLKSGVELGYAVCFTLFYTACINKFKELTKPTIPESLSDLIEEELLKTTDFGASQKLRNTVRFLNSFSLNVDDGTAVRV
jgi:hypothetical protein